MRLTTSALVCLPRLLSADDPVFLLSSKRRRCRRCFGGCLLTRRACIGLGAAICSVVTLVILLVGVYAIVPVIVRSQMANSTFDMTNVSIDGAPTNTSMHLVATGRIGNVMALTAKIHPAVMKLYQVDDVDASSPGSLSLTSSSSSSDAELGTLLFPGLTLHGPSDFGIDSTFTIVSSGPFAQWVRSVIFQSSVSWRIESSMSVTPEVLGISLPTYSGIALSKVVTIAACDGLQEVRLVSFDMRRSTADHIYINSAIEIDNPSAFAIDPLGALHFHFFYRGVKQGDLRSVSNQTFMNVGTTLLHFEGELAPDVTQLNVTRELVERYLTGQPCIVQAQPAANDGSSIPLYNGAFANLLLSPVLPGLTSSLISDVGVLSAHLTPSESRATIEFDLSVYFTVDSPLGPNGTMSANSLQMDVVVLWMNDTVDATGAVTTVAVPVGTLTMPEPTSVFPLDPSQGNHTLTFRTQVVATLALLEPYSNYEAFVGAFIAETGLVRLNFSGRANVSAAYLYGPLDIVDLPIVAGVSMQGGGGLKQTEEKQLDLLGNRACSTGPYCGVMMSMVASIVNPSVLTMNLSNAWFDLYWNNARLGSLEVTPLFMQPGYNGGMLASGFLNPAQADLPTMAQFMSEYVAGINHTVLLRGRDTDPNSDAPPAPGGPANAHDITLAGMTVSATSFGMTNVQLLGDFAITRFVIDFPPSASAPGTGEGTVLGVTALVTAEVSLPPSLQMPLTLLSSNLNVDVGANGPAFGTLVADRFPVAYKDGSNTSIMLDVGTASLTVTDASAFESFVTTMISSSTVSIDMDGQADPTAETNMGTLALTGISQRADIELRGYNSFLAPDGVTSLINMVHLDILSAQPAAGWTGVGNYPGGGTIEIACNVSLINPSQVAIRGIGLLELDMWWHGVRLATVRLANLSVESGTNWYSDTCRGTFWNPLVVDGNFTAELIARDFLSDYLNGGSNEVAISGRILQPDGTYQPGTTIPLLQPAFDSFRSSIVVPGNAIAFIDELVVTLNWEEVVIIAEQGGGILYAQARLYNPFSVGITVTSLNLTVLAGNLSAPIAGWLAPDPSFTSIYLPPHSSISTPLLPVFLLWTAPVKVCVLEMLMQHSTGLSLVGSLDVWLDVDGPGTPNPANIFNQTMHCAQNLITTVLGNLTATEPNEDDKKAAEQTRISELLQLLEP